VGVRGKVIIETAPVSPAMFLEHEVTRVPRGHRRTGLPPAAFDIRPKLPPARTSIPQREAPAVSEPSWSVTWPVVATHQASRSTLAGTTTEVSETGMVVHMPDVPVDVHFDVVVGDGGTCSMLWARVDRHDAAPRAGHLWRLSIVTADEVWLRLVRGVATEHRPR
jgi:hypothetical protein